MVVLTVRSVLTRGLNPLSDAALIEIKLNLTKRFLSMAIPKKKIAAIITFLNDYINFEKEENSIIFDEKLKQIEGREETMGIVEQVMVEREKRGRMEGMKLGERRGIERRNREVVINMLRKNFSDEMISDLTGVSLEYVWEIKNGK